MIFPGRSLPQISRNILKSQPSALQAALFAQNVMVKKMGKKTQHCIQVYDIYIYICVYYDYIL